MSFDDEQIELLLPLAAAGAVLHFPFFANTFPLGYHYFKTAKDPAARLVKLHDWKYPIPIDDLSYIEQPNIFYTTEATVHELVDQAMQANDASGSLNLKPLVVKHAFFTEYVPRIFFLRHSVDLDLLVKQYALDGRATHALVGELNNAYDELEIFTDIPDQAELVTTLLRENGFSKRQTVVKGWEEVFSAPPRQSRCLVAYFYGAPVSSALEIRPHEFIALFLPESVSRDPRFTTHISVVARATGDDEALLDDFKTRLDQYHVNLFDAARNRPSALRNVWLAYCRDALRRQHNSLFADPEAFAQCLISHHKREDSVQASQQSAKIVETPAHQSRAIMMSPTPSHVHFGAGNLGIGLVLPILTDAARLAVIQRPSDKWKCLESTKSVVVSTSAGWEKRMRVVYDAGDLTREQVQREYETWSSQPLLICSDDIAKFGIFIEGSETLSCSLGENQSTLARALRSLEFKRDVTIFPFENVPTLREVNPRVKIAQVVADRICRNRRIEMDSIRVDAEPFGEVVVQMDARQYGYLFKDPSEQVKITLTESGEIVRYYHKRKRYLMNSVHMVLAMYSYYHLAKSGINRADWDRQYLSFLQHVILDESSHLPLIRNFIDAQIMRLILGDRKDSNVFGEVFPGLEDEDIFHELRRYSNSVLKRTSESIDVLGRIFSLDDPAKAEAKYNELINQVVEFAERNKAEIDTLQIGGKPLANDVLATLRDVNKKIFVAFAFSTGARARPSK